MAHPPKPRAEGFKIECTCGKPGCDVVKEAEASKLANFLDAGLNTAALSLALLKEAASGTPVPGLRQAAGSALFIVETIQLMGDHKAAFKHLLHDAWDMTIVFVRHLAEKEARGEVISKQMEGIIGRFQGTLGEIREYVSDKLHRGWFMRMIYSRADKVKVDEYRIRLSQATSIFQVSTLLKINENTEEKVLREPKTLEEAEVALKKVHSMAGRVIEAEMDRRENAYIISHSYSTGNVSVQHTGPSFVNSPGASVHNVNSGNVTTTTYQNTGNDYSVSTVNNYGPAPAPASQDVPRRKKTGRSYYS